MPPAPKGLLKSTTFDLSAEEAGYLQGVFARHPGGSLLSWLAVRPERAHGPRLWTAPAVADLPEGLARSVEHARRLHHAWFGAPVLYNLMLAEVTERDDLVDEYRDVLDGWEDELAEHQVFDGWTRPTFWSHVRELNPHLRHSTQNFVERWFELVEAGEHRGERPLGDSSPSASCGSREGGAGCSTRRPARPGRRERAWGA